MNDIQKAQIRELRLQGVGYRKIAKETGMSENTVKSYCRRHPLSLKEPETEQAHHCLQCDSEIHGIHKNIIDRSPAKMNPVKSEHSIILI